jgi:hypothetical protein
MYRQHFSIGFISGNIAGCGSSIIPLEALNRTHGLYRDLWPCAEFPSSMNCGTPQIRPNSTNILSIATSSTWEQ